MTSSGGSRRLEQNAFQMELVQPLDPIGEESPLARARLHRRLTLVAAARRAGISEDEARWLEEGRVYRFPSADAALLTTLLYATALGIEHREARELGGLPVPAGPVLRSPLPRLIVLGAIAIAIAVLIAVVLVPRAGPTGGGPAHRASGPVLPPAWRIQVSVLNGSGDITYTRQEASRIGALAYRIVNVGRADNFRHPQTAVYYAPGGEGVALRLARQLGVVTEPLPGGTDPGHLFVIVGPARGPGE